MKYVNKDFLKGIASAGVTLTLVASSYAVVYLYENKEQDVDIPYKISDTYKNENGEISKLFDVGEHKVIVSRNDILFKSDMIEGYTIESVKKDNIFVKYNIKITYVNTEPVIAKGKIIGDNVYFNEFGSVQKENAKTK